MTEQENCLETHTNLTEILGTKKACQNFPRGGIQWFFQRKLLSMMDHNGCSLWRKGDAELQMQNWSSA